MRRPELTETKNHRRRGLGPRLLVLGLGSGLAVGHLLLEPASAVSQDRDGVAETAATALALAREIKDAEAAILGSLMFYDPTQDVAGGVDGAAYGPGDRAWVEAALGIYDLYRQIGGEAGDQRYLFRRDPDRVFVGLEGGWGHWHGSVEEGLAAFLRLLARSSRALPESLRLATLHGGDRALGPVVEDLIATLGETDKILLLPAGGSTALRIEGAWHAIGTSGLAVEAVPTAEGDVIATVRRSAGDPVGPQRILAFREGRRFTASETIEVGFGTGPATRTDIAATAVAPRPDRLDPGQTAPVHDAIGTSGETRRYAISIPSAGGYEIGSTGPSDVMAQLKGPDGVLVARDDDSGDGYNFNLRATLKAGDYTLEISHCCAGTGPFALSVSAK